MFKKVLILSFTLLVLFASQSTIAANQEMVEKTIVKIRTYEKFAAVQFSPATTSTLGCTGTVTSDWAIIDFTADPDRKSMYSAALGAYLLNRPVSFGVTDSYGCGAFGGGTPLMYRLDM